MSELDSGNSGIPAAGPPSKRRRVVDGSSDSTPRYSSPDDHVRDDQPDGGRDATELPTRGLSIRRGRPPTRSLSRSPSRARDDEEKSKRYSSRTPSSRSRSRSASSHARRRSYSRSRSRSRSRLGSDSPSPSPSRSRSRSRLHTRRPSASSSVTSSRRRLSPSASQQPPESRQPAKPRYQQRLELNGHAAAVSQVRISPDGRWIASASADGTARVWDAATGAHLDTLVGHMAGVSCVAWSPDSDILATGSDDKAIRLWDRVTASPAHAVGQHGERPVPVRGGLSSRGGRTGRAPLLGHHNYVYCLAFSPKGNILASGSYDEAVFLWDVRAGRLMRSLPAHSDPVRGLDFCKDGTLVASCSTDGLIRIWDTSTGQCLRTLVHEDNPGVSNVCFSPNGRYVLAFNLDNFIRLWDYVSGSVKKTYQGHENSGFSIGGAFGSLDTERGGISAFIASASEDGDVVMWDVKSKRIVQRIPKVHEGVCFWVDIHGNTLVSAGQDGVIKVFRQRGNTAARLEEATNGASVADHGSTNGLKDESVTPYLSVADGATPIKQEHGGDQS